MEFFIRSNLMSKMSLDEYLAVSEDNTVSLWRLSILQMLQETAATLASDAGLTDPPNLIRPVLEEALRTNKSLQRLQPWKFQVTVKGDLVKQLVAKLVPYSWQCQLTSEGDRVATRTVGNLCLDPPSPFCNPQSAAGDLEQEMTIEETEEVNRSNSNDKMGYYFTTSFSIKRFV